MTITNLMHVTGNKADLYSSSYFKAVEGERPAINPFNRWVDGSLYALGTVTDTLGTSRVVIDLTAAKEVMTITADSADPMAEIEACLSDNETIAKQYAVSSPTIPPSKSFISWKYRTLTKEHQFSNWVVDKWIATTEYETLYLKYNTSEEMMKPLTRTVTSDTVVQPLKQYYYINKFDYKQPTVVDLPCKIGDDIQAIAQELKQHFLDKYTISEEEATIEITEVDITQADYYDADTEKDASLMGYWLGQLRSSPKMISVDQNPDVIATYGNHDDQDTRMEGDFEYRHALPDAVFDFKKAIVKRGDTLPICNGLVCYPILKDEKIYAVGGQRLSYNKKDRNRRWVLVDFSPVGGAQFIPLANLQGPLTEMTIPVTDDGQSMIDTSKQSVLLVVRGRLFFPGEFEIVNNQYLLFDRTQYTAVHELDRMVCRGDFKWNSRVLEPRQYTKEFKDHRTTEQIKTYKKTSDQVFMTGKKYYVNLLGTFIEIDVSKIIGDSIHKYLEPIRQMTTIGSREYNEDEIRERIDTIVSSIKNIDDHILIKCGVYDPEYIYANLVHDDDGQIFFNEFYEYTDETISHYDREVVVTTHEKEVDLKNDINSFLIVINKPGLRIIHHKCFEGPWPVTKMLWGTDAKTGTMKVDFDRQVRGLLFDEQSKSVIDYTRETQSLTFYADKFRKWGIANVSANWSSLLAVTDESSHNSMISRGFVLDVCHTDKYDHVVWPKLSILDFVFRD